MVKQIVQDVLFLSRKAEEATREDLSVVQDLLDTLKDNDTKCVGMAANMIGVNKRIIVVNIGVINVPMLNPVIIRKTEAYEAEEGCLSLNGVRKVIRYREIEVEYRNVNFVKQRQKYFGWTAQIIQHEIDHCNGIVI